MINDEMDINDEGMNCDLTTDNGLTGLAIPFQEILWTILLSVLLYYILDRIKYYRSLPPGPWGLPLVGYLPWILRSTAPHNSYLKLASKYGDISSLTLGNNLIVCIASAKLVRDLFSRVDSTGRPHTPLNNLLKGRGIILSEGELWKQQRIFLSQKFRCLGVKFWEKQRFEKYILNEVQEFLETLTSLQGVAVDPNEMLGRHIHNVICQLMMSFRFKEGDPEFKKYNECVAEGMRIYGSLQIGEHLPQYLKLPGKAVALKAMDRNLKDVCIFNIQQIDLRCAKRLAGPTPPADMLDYYLDAMDSTQEQTLKLFPGSSTKEDLVKQTVQVMNDLFSAGMETSRNALVWTIVMMLREPQVADRVRAELAKVVSPGEEVTLEHRTKLTYIEAVIYETLRRIYVVPLGTTHVNATPWKVGKYIIPPGSHIVPLINKIHMDPEAFPEPEKFNPERFLVNGKLQNLSSFIPFGIGRRKCLGEALARMELFLFFSNMMNSFKFELGEGEAMPGLDGQLTVTHAPLAFRVRFKIQDDKDSSDLGMAA